MRQSLDRLRLDAVVRGHDQDGDVRRLSAARAHLREGLVTRCVDERDGSTVLVNLIGTDVLRDAPVLLRDNVRLPDLVEQQRLPVVDVAHDGDHRGSRRQQRLVLGLFFFRQILFVLRRDDLQLVPVVGRDDLGGLVAERLRNRVRLSEQEQLLDDLRRGDAELRCKLRDRDAAVDRERLGLCRRGSGFGRGFRGSRRRGGGRLYSLGRRRRSGSRLLRCALGRGPALCGWSLGRRPLCGRTLCRRAGRTRCGARGGELLQRPLFCRFPDLRDDVVLDSR